MLWLFYNLLFPVVFVLMLPKFISRMLKRGGYGQHFEQRLGFFSPEICSRFQETQRIWIHAVSVGEIYVALRFIEAHRAKHPGARFALSTTTSTAHRIGRQEVDSRDVLFYFPVDLPVIIRKVLRVVNPSGIILVEGEFWPNLIRLADRRDIPISLINGRMSENSYKGYRRLRPLMADVLGRVNPLCVQSALDAERFEAVGAPKEHLQVMGTVKFDVAKRDTEGERNAEAVLRRISVAEDAVILLGGSTWPGEEDALLRIYQRLQERYPSLFLILVPRHAERSGEVVDVLEAAGVSFVRRSTLDSFAGECAPDVLLIDTTGELRGFYSQADLVFVGKSLTQHGGQNPIEPAMYGRSVIVGPNMENFPSVMDELLRRDALIQVNSEEELSVSLERLIGDAEERVQLGRRAAAAVLENRGVIERTVELFGE